MPGPKPLADLTDAQVQAGARPGESWEEARNRLYLELFPVCSPSGAPGSKQRPAYLDPPLAGVRPDQLEALWAFQNLSKAEQLLAHGAVRHTVPLQDSPQWADLVAVGRAWNACTARLPHQDKRGSLFYLVAVVYDESWLTCCRYTPLGWARACDGSLISGAAHWRIAFEHEQISREATTDEIRTLRALRQF